MSGRVLQVLKLSLLGGSIGGAVGFQRGAGRAKNPCKLANDPALTKIRALIFCRQAWRFSTI